MSESELLKLACEASYLPPDLVREEVSRPDWSSDGLRSDWTVGIPRGLRESWESLSLETKLALFASSSAMSKAWD